jgi:Uma2 family endonuclease
LPLTAVNTGNPCYDAAMSAPLSQPWTQEEFFTWAAAREGRYEFDGFRPVAMTGGSAVHSQLMRKLHLALGRRLDGGACEPLGPDAGVETANKAIRYPDALITCSKFGPNDRTIPGVVIVFEILSPSTSSTDRIVKLREYLSVPTIRRYVIVEYSTVALIVMERSEAEDTWRVAALTEHDTLRMPEIGIEIPVAEIYNGITLPAPEAG